MAASLAIERSRRNRIELSKDDRNDEEIMVVAVTPDGLNWLPEFGTTFNLVTNLLNPDFQDQHQAFSYQTFQTCAGMV